MTARAVKSSADQEVKLRSDPLVWKKLPTAVRIALKDGVVRVERVRAEIAAASKVGIMPRVQCVPEVWIRPDNVGSIDGMSGTVRLGGQWQLCATLPAQTIVCDDDVIRRVLVHEFAHAFDTFTRVIDHIDAGEHGVLTLGNGDADDYDDVEHDDSRLAPPSDWFGEEDVENFVHWNSEIGERIHARLLELDLARVLPVRSPDRRFELDSIVVPVRVIERVRELRSERQGRPT